jgi:hypothetical protein
LGLLGLGENANVYAGTQLFRKSRVYSANFSLQELEASQRELLTAKLAKKSREGRKGRDFKVSSFKVSGLTFLNSHLHLHYAERIPCTRKLLQNSIPVLASFFDTRREVAESAAKKLVSRSARLLSSLTDEQALVAGILSACK